MRILLASLPADGHFNPLTGIAATCRPWPRRAVVRRTGVRLQDRPSGMRVVPVPAGDRGHGRQPQRPVPRARCTEGAEAASPSTSTSSSSARSRTTSTMSSRSARSGRSTLLLCDGAFYAEQLVADLLGIPVYAVALTMVMPDSQSPPPFFGLRPARTPVGKLQHAIVRKLLAQRHEGRHHPVQRDPRSARHRPNLARRLPARADAAGPPGLPQRVAGTGVPRLPATHERRVRRAAGSRSPRDRPGTPRSRTSSSIPRGKS